MLPDQTYDLREISSHFQIDGEFLGAIPYGNGHINDTYASGFKTARGVVRYVHQRINHHVFKEPEKVMENMLRVTCYAREQILAAGGDPARGTLNLVPARDGKWFYRCPKGNTWRTHLLIEGATTYDTTENLHVVYSAARAFGGFQRLLSSLPGERLYETIPDFHHTRKRFEAFTHVLERDAANRAAQVKPEIDFILCREADASIVVDMLAQGRIPERVTHNDTKINNVLIDDASGEGICVIDLDTVMPGSVLYDFGDMVRAGATSGAEDEPDLTKVSLNMDLFIQLSRGYIDAVRDFLDPAEFDLLAFAGKLITYEQAIRFLGDYINGDT